MLGFRKKIGRPPKQVGARATYRQVAVTPEAHAKLRELADKRNSTIIDTFDDLIGV